MEKVTEKSPFHVFVMDRKLYLETYSVESQEQN